jgi:hypothetical protein
VTSPLASFDVLALTGAVGSSTNGLTQGELQVLDYLACLMALYDGRTPSWWGFGFSVTETGAPFAHELSTAASSLIDTGWLSRDGRVYRLTRSGGPELEFQGTLALHRPRARYLTAATSSALAMPLPELSDALSYEPGLARAMTYIRRKQLLDETSLTLLAGQFRALTEGLKRDPHKRDDLMVPTIVWLTYLSRERGRSERNAA